METFKIDSVYYNEHNKELQFFVGNAIHCTLHCENEPTDEEAENLCKEVELLANLNKVLKKITQ